MTMTVEVLPKPPERDLRWGRWAPLVERLERLGGQKTYRIRPPLTQAQARSLRSAAWYRGRGLHIRQDEGETCVWLGLPINISKRRRIKP